MNEPPLVSYQDYMGKRDHSQSDKHSGRWPWPSEFSDPSKAPRQPRINRRARVSESELMVWPLPVRIVSG
jgi:hypothetical protein